MKCYYIKDWVTFLLFRGMYIFREEEGGKAQNLMSNLKIDFRDYFRGEENF